MQIKLFSFLIPWFIFLTLTSLGEGTRQLQPDSTVSQAGLYFDSYSGGSYTNFGLINCLPNYRLCIHIKNAGESILFGMKSEDYGITYNLRKPNGTIALTGLCPTTPTQTGYIRYYKQAITGPFPAIGGYNPLSYQVTSVADTGDYYFEVINPWSMIVPLWDFQVVSGQHTPSIQADTLNGRVWSQSWQLYAYLLDNVQFNGCFYVYSDDGIVTRLKFNDTRVGAVAIFCNPYGCLNTGNFESDRRSLNLNSFINFPGIAQYKVFLNNPDSTIYPSGVYGEITNTPFMTEDTLFPPCSGHKRIMVEVNKPGKVEVVITLPYGGSSTTVNFLSSVTPGINAIPWDGKDGLGNPVPDGTMINVNVTFVNGLTNLPIWDQEQNKNGFLISLVRPINPSVLTPLTFWDDTQLTGGGGMCPVAPQSSNLTGCSPGSIQGYTGCHPWGLNNDDCHDKMINTWWYGSTSVKSFTDQFSSGPSLPVGYGATRCGPGSVTLHASVFLPVTVDWYDVPTGGTPLLSGDTIFITPFLQNTATFYAESRNPVTGCIGGTRVPVIATIIPVTPATLSGPTQVCEATIGSLYFTDAGKINYQWVVSPGGIITGGWGTNTITVNWIGGGYQLVSVNYHDPSGCEGIISQALRVGVVPFPEPAGNISGADSVCMGSYGLTYSIDPVVAASDYVWSVPPGVVITSGAGTHSITVDFPPGVQSGIFTVYTTNICGSGLISPPFPVVVLDPPLASAGPDTSLCQGIPYTAIFAHASEYRHLTWHTSGTGFLDQSDPIHPVYNPGIGEIGAVALTMTAEGFYPCHSDTSTLILTYLPAPQVEAGEDIASCGNNPVNLVEASAFHAINYRWSTSGSGFFNDPALIHPTYTPDSLDITTGNVWLMFSATGATGCPASTDSLLLMVSKHVEVSAGPDITRCGAEPVTIVYSMAINFDQLHWRTSGDGTFSDNSILQPIYTPGSDDINHARVLLSLEATGKGSCPPGMDTLAIHFQSRPQVTAGPDLKSCQPAQIFITDANAFNISSLKWSHNGRGALSNSDRLNAVYTPSLDESGLITLTLTATGSGDCGTDTVADNMKIEIYKAVMAWAGDTQTINSGSSAALSGTGAGGSENYHYRWEPAGLVYDPQSDSTSTMVLTSSTWFYFEVTDVASNCTSTDSTLISVVKPNNTEECLVIHNVITPNGDGVNDTWKIDCIESFPLNQVTIFDRWGDKINEFHNYNNEGTVWKGTNLKNEPVPDGTYYYTLAIQNGGTYSGWVFVRSNNR